MRIRILIITLAFLVIFQMVTEATKFSVPDRLSTQSNDGKFLHESDWHGDVLYFVLIDRFFNGNTANDNCIDRANPAAFHGGDLAGLRQKLDYLADLGVSALWLSPVATNRPTPFYKHHR